MGNDDVDRGGGQEVEREVVLRFSRNRLYCGLQGKFLMKTL
jgi:hypothetical protein